MANNTTVAQVLRDAAQILRERGHCKGALGDPQGRVCALGAIDVAAHRNRLPPDDKVGIWEWFDTFVFDELATPQMCDMVECGARPTPLWNDADDRTQTEVEKALLLAADRAEFGEQS